jgi:Fe2+ or Zn2+ uptake regulation protein
MSASSPTRTSRGEPSCGAEDDLSLDEAESLERLIMKHKGFRPDLTHFAISGLCRNCRPKR